MIITATGLAFAWRQALCQALDEQYLKTPRVGGTTLSPMSELRKPRVREINQLAGGKK